MRVMSWVLLLSACGACRGGGELIAQGPDAPAPDSGEDLDTDDGPVVDDEPIDTGIVGPVCALVYPAPPALPPRSVSIREIRSGKLVGYPLSLMGDAFALHPDSNGDGIGEIVTAGDSTLMEEPWASDACEIYHWENPFEHRLVDTELKGICYGRGRGLWPALLQPYPAVRDCPRDPSIGDFLSNVLTLKVVVDGPESSPRIVATGLANVYMLSLPFPELDEARHYSEFVAAHHEVGFGISPLADLDGDGWMDHLRPKDVNGTPALARNAPVDRRDDPSLAIYSTTVLKGPLYGVASSPCSHTHALDAGPFDRTRGAYGVNYGVASDFNGDGVATVVQHGLSRVGSARANEHAPTGPLPDLILWPRLDQLGPPDAPALSSLDTFDFSSPDYYPTSARGFSPGWFQVDHLPRLRGSCLAQTLVADAPGDVDGDGRNDLVVYAFPQWISGREAGALYLVTDVANTPSGANSLPDRATAVFLSDSGGPSYFGMVRPFVLLDDLTGDGHREVAIAGPNAVGIFVGPFEGVIRFDAAALWITGELSDWVRVGGMDAGYDIDGDGLRDLALGTIFDEEGGPYAGAIHVIRSGDLAAYLNGAR